MPELPEVETVVRDLRPLLAGRVIERVAAGRLSLRRPWHREWSQCLAKQRFNTLHRRGKWIIAGLHNHSALLLHLGMTGQLTVNDAADQRADHIHLILHLEGGRELRFRDVRRFGSAEFFRNLTDLQSMLDRSLGPEPFAVDPAFFRTRLKQADRPLKAVLLDQRVLAGVGNIYADEACFRAKLHPGRRACTLLSAEAERLRLAVEAVLTRAIDGRGSTIRDYVGGSGLMGTYQNEFQAYGRTGEPCGRCGTPIAMQRIAGRSSHFCPKCQRMRPAGRG